MTRPSLQDVTPADRHRADAAPSGCVRCTRRAQSPLAPVVAVISGPVPLRPRPDWRGNPRRVGACSLPASPPFTLASSLTAIQLPAGLRARSERLLAGRATPTLHADTSALSSKARSLDSPTPDDGHTSARQGRHRVNSNEQTRVGLLSAEGSVAGRKNRAMGGGAGDERSGSTGGRDCELRCP